MTTFTTPSGRQVCGPVAMAFIATATAVYTSCSPAAKSDFEVTYRIYESLVGKASAPPTLWDSFLVATPPDGIENRFKIAAQCDKPSPSRVRGLILGRFDDRLPPKDTLMEGAVITLTVEADTAGNAGRPHKDHQKAGQWGQFYFSAVPTTGLLSLEVSHPLAQRFPYLLAQGPVDSFQARCILPSIDGRVPLSSRNLDAMRFLQHPQ